MQLPPVVLLVALWAWGRCGSAVEVEPCELKQQLGSKVGLEALATGVCEVCRFVHGGAQEHSGDGPVDIGRCVGVGGATVNTRCIESIFNDIVLNSSEKCKNAAHAQVFKDCPGLRGLRPKTRPGTRPRPRGGRRPGGRKKGGN